MVIRAAIIDFWESKIFSIQGSSNWKNHNKNKQKTTKNNPPNRQKMPQPTKTHPQMFKGLKFSTYWYNLVMQKNRFNPLPFQYLNLTTFLFSPLPEL